MATLLFEDLVDEYLLASEFDAEVLSDQLATICFQLQINPVKDADRVGEPLSAVIERYSRDRSSITYRWSILGSHTRSPYLSFDMTIDCDEIDEPLLESFNALATALLTAALNGPQWLTPIEQMQLRDLIRAEDGMCCAACGEAFLFYEQVLAHREQECPRATCD